MSSSTPWSLSVLTLSVRSVLPSILSKISALQISDFSLLNRSAHTLRYRRFASILTDANARLAVEVVVSLLPPVGLSPTTLRQLAWRTDSCRLLLVLGYRTPAEVFRRALDAPEDPEGVGAGTRARIGAG